MPAPPPTPNPNPNPACHLNPPPPPTLQDAIPGGITILCNLLDHDQSGFISREEFLAAQDADFGLFERMGPSAEDLIDVERFTRFVLNLIVEEGVAPAVDLVKGLTAGAEKRWASRQNDPLGTGVSGQLSEEEQGEAARLFDLVDQERAGSLVVADVGEVILPAIAKHILQGVPGGTCSKVEWMERLGSLRVARKSNSIASYYLEWLNGTLAGGFQGGVPRCMPAGLIGLFSQVTRLSGQPDLAKDSLVACQGGDFKVATNPEPSPGPEPVAAGRCLRKWTSIPTAR
jgi:hypothetical protein